MTTPPTGGGADALARARLALQERDGAEAGWPELAERVNRRVRSVSRPGRPLVVQDTDAGTLRVDQRVVVDVVRRAVAAVPGCRPVGVEVVAGPGEGAAAGAGRTVASLRLQVAARYGADLHEVAAAARAATVTALGPVLGRGCPVDVAVVDLQVEVDDVAAAP